MSLFHSLLSAGGIPEYTNAAGQEVNVIIGDSIANGNSAAAGPTPTSGTVYEFDGSSIVEVSNADLLDANVGSPWPRFGIDHYTRTGKKPVFVNTAVPGSAFYYPPDANLSWRAGDNLYPAAKTKIDNALLAVGVRKVKRIFIILGVNDSTASETLGNISTAITSLITRLNTDYGTPDIRIVMIGRSSAGANTLKCVTIRNYLKQAAFDYANVHIAGSLVSYFGWGFYQVDNVHITQAGNNYLGSQLDVYESGVLTYEKYANTIISSLYTALSSARKTVINDFVLSNLANIKEMDHLYFFKAADSNNLLFDWGLLVAPTNQGLSVLTANTHITTNGSSTWFGSNVDRNSFQKRTASDQIEGIKIKDNRTAFGTIANAIGGSDGTQKTRIAQSATNVVYGINIADATATSAYATDTTLQDNTLYSVARNGGTQYLFKGGTQVASAAVAGTGTGINAQQAIGTYNNNGSLANYNNADYEYCFYAKFTTLDLATLHTGLETMLTNW